jgi:heme-degrading monooxygenase HmoA
MIIRLWTAHATPEGAVRYEAHFASHVRSALRGLDGYRGASLLRRIHGDEVELVVLTRWQSIDSVRAFAGTDIERAVVAPEAAAVLTRWDPRVRHHEVLVEDDASAPDASRA